MFGKECLTYLGKAINIGALIVLFSFIAFNGCSKFGVDETNLEQVANYYYQPGKEKELAPKKAYEFLSTKSKEITNYTEYEKYCNEGKEYKISEIKVLSEKEANGKKYGIVSVYSKKEKENAIFTNSWILEDGKWRRLSIKKLLEEAGNAFSSGDYAVALAKANECLAIDPFSVNAYQLLGFAMNKSNTDKFKREDRTMDDIVRSLLSINPEDSQVLFFAVTFSEDLSIAKNFLRKMQGHVGYSTAAFNAILKIESPREKLKFLDGIELTTDLAMLKMYAFAQLEKWNDFRSLSNNEGTFEKIKEKLEESDPSFSAGWAARLGFCFHVADDDYTARKYLEYGITRDPNNELIRKLAKTLD